MSTGPTGPNCKSNRTRREPSKVPNTRQELPNLSNVPLLQAFEDMLPKSHEIVRCKRNVSGTWIPDVEYLEIR